MEILIILFLLLAIESDVYFQFCFWNFLEFGKNCYYKTKLAWVIWVPYPHWDQSKILKLELKKWDKKVRPLKLKKLMQNPNSSWESIEISKDFIKE